MTLKDAKAGVEYIIKRIETEDEELDAFLFSLGCYSGEAITVVSHLKGGCMVSILVCIVGGAGFYLYRAKKKGQKCIGCPYAGKCKGNCDTQKEGA